MVDFQLDIHNKLNLAGEEPKGIFIIYYRRRIKLNLIYYRINP